MDNVEVVDLPSNVLPTVTGKKSIICRAADGSIYFVTASGAKRLLTVDEKYEIGDHAIQFYGERTPAQKYGGTWKIDSEYAGLVIIGSGGGYTFGAKGGEEKHIQTIAEMPSHNHIINVGRSSAGDWAKPNVTLNTSTNYENSMVASDSYASENRGGGQPFNIMQPYFVQNIWKRIA